jgi:large subunit ribosomal protein L32
VFVVANPKRKTSKARRDSRRAQNYKMSAPGITECPQCHEMKLAHRVCKNCGHYKGKEVVASEA